MKKAERKGDCIYRVAEGGDVAAAAAERGGHEERDYNARLSGLASPGRPSSACSYPVRGPRTTTWHGHGVGPRCLICARECNVKAGPCLTYLGGTRRFDYCLGGPRLGSSRGWDVIFGVTWSILQGPLQSVQAKAPVVCSSSTDPARP